MLFVSTIFYFSSSLYKNYPIITIMSPRMKYVPSSWIFVPLSLYSRSSASDKIQFIAWSKPRNTPTKTRPSVVITLAAFYIRSSRGCWIIYYLSSISYLWIIYFIKLIQFNDQPQNKKFFWTKFPDLTNRLNYRYLFFIFKKIISFYKKFLSGMTNFCKYFNFQPSEIWVFKLKDKW